MSHLARNHAITVSASGANITTGAASANVAVPNSSSGQRARFVRLQATAAAYVRPGPSVSIAAAAGDLLLDPTSPIILNVAGHTHIAAIQVAAAGIVNVTPLED